MKFIVASRNDIERGIVVRTPYVVVSITDPGTRRPRIPKPAGFRDAMYLQFHDAEPVKGERLPSEIVLMTRGHAEMIWDFVSRHQDRVGTVVVHCEQGMSRSPAVAAAIAKRFDINNDCFFLQWQPNVYIYALMCSTAADNESAADRHLS